MNPFAGRRRDGEADRARAARLIRVRTRHQVTDIFAGSYASAFRGDGIEYAESRPYVPGDDIRSLDWNAMARTGVPHVKRHRSERGRRLLLVLEASGSMAFGTTGRSKVAAACEALGLLAAAALKAGDRVGLVLHETSGINEIRPDRGEAQLHRILEASCAAAERASGHVRSEELEAMLERRVGMGTIVCHFSDFRNPDQQPTATHSAMETRTGGVPTSRPRRRGERVWILCSDPHEEILPDVGLLSVVDPGQANSPWLFDTADPASRARFEQAAALRISRIAHSARSGGDDFVHFRADHDALHMWIRFFRSRANRWNPGT